MTSKKDKKQSEKVTKALKKHEDETGKNFEDKEVEGKSLKEVESLIKKEEPKKKEKKAKKVNQKEEFRKFFKKLKKEKDLDKSLESIIWLHLKAIKHDKKDKFADGVKHFGIK